MRQLQLQLTDHLYEQALRRALEAGFKSVEEYASDVLTNDLSDEFDSLFTPDRLAHIDRVAAAVDAGEKTLSLTEVREGLAKNRARWIQTNSR